MRSFLRIVIERRDVPLAGGGGCVAGGSQDLGNGHAIFVESTAITFQPAVLHHVSDTCLVGVEPGQQRGARRTAAPRVIKLREPHPVVRELIEIRCSHLAAITADVAVAHVVRHHQHDVWRIRR